MVHAYDSLTEQAFEETPKQGVRDVVAMLSDPTPSTVCIHRPTKRKLVRALGHETYQPVDLALSPAEYLIFHRGAKFDDVGGVRKVKVGEGTVIEYGAHH